MEALKGLTLGSGVRVGVQNAPTPMIFGLYVLMIGSRMSLQAQKQQQPRHVRQSSVCLH